MAIKLRNHAESEDFNGGISGVLTTALLGGIYLIPFPMQLRAIMARLGTAGGTQATIIDILKNGITIFSGATKVNFAIAATVPTYGPLTVNPTPFAKGDICKIIITQVGSAAAPADLAIAVLFQRFRQSGPVAAMITDGMGTENE